MTEAEQKRLLRESQKRSEELIAKIKQCHRDMDQKLKDILRVI